MITITADTEGSIFQCPSPQESDFDLETEENEVVLSASSSTNVEIDDAFYQRNISASVRYDARVSYLPQSGGATMPQYRSANNSLATVSSDGYITTTGTGEVDIFCRAFQTTKKITHNARTQSAVTSDTFVNYLDGTVGAAATAALDALLAAGGDLNLFSSTNPFARNANCWAASLDWTGVSPTNSVESLKRGGTLISPRHLVWADHYNIPNGTVVTFVDAQNQIVTRTVSASTTITGTDIRVGVLSSDVPETISFYPIMPTDWRDYLVNVSFVILPLLTTDQEKKAICTDLSTISASNEFVQHGQFTSGFREPFSERIVVGDSGQPLFMLVGASLVLLGCHRSPNACPNLVAYTTEINAAMTTLGGGYQLTTADLSAFTNFAN